MCMYVCVCVCVCVRAQWWPAFHGLWPASLLCPWNFPGKNTGMGCRYLLERIFPIQGSDPGLQQLAGTIFTTVLPRKPKEDK